MTSSLFKMVDKDATATTRCTLLSAVHKNRLGIRCSFEVTKSIATEMEIGRGQKYYLSIHSRDFIWLVLEWV